MKNNSKQIQHLYLRSGFGITPPELEKVKDVPVRDLVEGLFSSSVSYSSINYIANPLKDKEDEVSNFKILKMILKSKKQMEEMNEVWLNKMAEPRAVLREKMTFFWHNHFSTSTPFAYLMQIQNNTIRKHALGKFSDLLHGISKDPAMIIYLNNQQNHKDAPNENFAREVMELFTLGQGNEYTEHDIKEAARAFTGWTVNRKGEFEIIDKQHDWDQKEIFGKTGNFNGNEVIDILLAKKQTARYVVSKIYRDFINENIHNGRVEELATVFYDSGYDISLLMRTIFTSSWFYEDENIGCKIASPVELLVRYKKWFSITFEEEKQQLTLQKVMGQVLFFPPNVAGWKGGQAWIDSASLMLRLNLPRVILKGAELDVNAKPDFEDSPDNEKKRKGLVIKSNWKPMLTFLKKKKEKKLADQLLEYCIQCPGYRINKQIIEEVAVEGDEDENILTTLAAVMSLPEFQLI